MKINKSNVLMPFYIHLKNFEKINYTKSKMYKNYRSTILLIDNKLEWKYKIEMNKPLIYKNYKIYQSSFIENENYFTSIFSVSNNNNKYIYLSFFIMILGFILNLIKFKYDFNFKKKNN